MADKELKPKSFRIDDLTAEQFRKIAEETGGNQQQTLARLIDIYEMQKNKEELPEKRAEIDQMDEYLNAIRLKYFNSLADNVHQETIVREKLAARMEKQDAEISEMKQKIQEAEQARKAAAEELKALTEKNSQTQKELENAKIQLTDKEKLNQALQASCTSLQLQINALKEDAKKTEEMQKELIRLQKESAELQNIRKNLEDQLEKERVKAQFQEQFQKQQAEIHLGKALLEQERAYQEQIRKLSADNLAEVSKYQQMYRELLDQMKKQTAAAKLSEKEQKKEPAAAEESPAEEKKEKQTVSTEPPAEEKMPSETASDPVPEHLSGSEI